MPFIDPMLASPLPADFKLEPGRWVAEEKFDGHRLILEVLDTPADLFHPRTAVAWSRDGLSRALPTHILDAAQSLPVGVYDGELLVPGRRSYGVTRLDCANKLVFVAFDILEVCGKPATALPLLERRNLLTMAMTRQEPDSPIRASEWTYLMDEAEIPTLAAEVWARDGEGLILKDVQARYEAGKRRKTWIKIKAQRHATLTVTGFATGRLGACSIVLLEDEDGVKTTVKAKNLAIRARIEVDPSAYIGRRLVIEYQERTPDGGYRHGMWDRWEDE